MFERAATRKHEVMKDPLVSVIVPTHNSGKTIGACLASILVQTYPNVEIVVVDNNSDDNTRQIASTYTDKVLVQGPERSAQRNYGAQVSRGDYLLFPDCDMDLSRNVIRECINKVEREPAIKAIVVPEVSFGAGFWARCRKLERSYYIGVEWLEAARFFERSAFEEMEGYDLRNTGTEDFDLPQRIRAKYGPLSHSRVSSFVYHDEQDMSLIETCKTNYYYGQKLDVYRSVDANKENFRKQYNIMKRYSLFFSDPRRLFSDPLLGLGTLLMKACDLGAWASGFAVAKAAEYSRNLKGD